MSLIVCLVLGLATPMDLQSAETSKLHVLLSGQLVGGNTVVQRGKTWSSAGSFAVDGTTIDSKVFVEQTGTKISKFSFDEVSKKGEKVLASTLISFDGRKATAKNRISGAETPIKATIDWPVMANWHSLLLSKLTEKVDLASKKPQVFNTFLCEAARSIPITITMSSKRTVVTSAGPVEVNYASFGIAGLAGEVAMGPKKEFLGLEIRVQKIQFIREGYENVFADPITKFPELSQATSETVSEELSTTLSDGAILRSTLVRPKKAGAYPVIFSRTPYGRSTSLDASFARRGYAVISQDVRGTGESKGAFTPMVTERKDGNEMIDWISKQPWCDGNIGMIGGSYGGFVQWAAAADRHPALKCIIPQVSPPASAMWNLPYENGVFMFLTSLWWLRIVDGPNGVDLSAAAAKLVNMQTLGALPLNTVDEKFLGFNSKSFDRWLSQEGESKWAGWNFEADLAKVTLPVLHISGWFDGDEIGTQRNWQALRNAGHKNQWLIYGPWVHAFNTASSVADVDFGPSSIIDLDSLYIRWFDTWLKHKAVNLDAVPKVKYFEMGSNSWRTSPDWPPADYVASELQFTFSKRKIADVGYGELVAKTKSSSAQSYTYDPKIGPKRLPKEAAGATDSSVGSLYSKEAALAEAGVILRTPILGNDLSISGPISVEFDFKSSAKDTDFFATMYDFDGKKYRYVGTPGKLRAAFVNGLDKPVPLKMNATYRAKISLWDSAYKFAKGHQLVVVIVSDMFPSSARNLGTCEPIATATRMVKQRNVLMSSVASPGVVRFYRRP